MKKDEDTSKNSKDEDVSKLKQVGISSTISEKETNSNLKTDYFDIDFQKVIHDSFPKEAKTNVKQHQDISKTSVQRTNSDLRKEEGSSKASKDGDASNLKHDNIYPANSEKVTNSNLKKDDFSFDFQKMIHSFPKEAKTNVKQHQDISKTLIQGTNSDLKKRKY